MDTPQVSRIGPYARVSAVSRSEEGDSAKDTREFTALLINEDAAARRRHRSAPDDEPKPAEDADERPDEAESLIEAQAPGEAEDVLPEDAHDPQELRALLTNRHD
ncbi:hypothetical protein M2322_001444 [Rhodoblastus acidophilus]|uniref:hypothetical protein n=1 Tax=Rhodoblastus acidophilus TaxID=1074 RepID=UPI0022247C5D|nr:hypothetical protein [Rhodoblastus acidophilus]MCW2315900.1 hypothetical protein [Rhodoblastus acidophilus]